MTAIVGIIKDGIVSIGGDSAGSNGATITVRKDTKVFKKGDFIFGFTSSYRMGQLLKYSFVPPEYNSSEPLEKYMSTHFIDALRDCLKEKGYAGRSNEQEWAGTFLVGFQGHLFKVCSDYQVGEPLCGYDATGCGESVALGSLFSTNGDNPLRRIKIALEAAEHHCEGVRGPFVIESL